MNQNIYCKPRLYIGDLEIVDFDSFKLNQPGANQINNLDIVLSDVRSSFRK